MRLKTDLNHSTPDVTLILPKNAEVIAYSKFSNRVYCQSVGCTHWCGNKKDEMIWKAKIPFKFLEVIRVIN